MNIKNDKAFKKIFLKKVRSKNTIKKYNITLKKFSKFTGLTPTELVKEAKEEQISYINDKNQIIEPEIEDTKLAQYFEEYYEHEKKRGQKLSTIQLDLTLIRSFYRRNDVKKLPSPIEIETKETELILLKKEKIKRAINKADPRGKALITFMASTGIRSIDIRNFKIRDLLKALNIKNIRDLLDNEDQITGYWKFKPQKTQKKGNLCKVCNTPESTKYIIEYLNTRKDKITEESYLFQSRQRRKIASATFIYFFDTMDQKLYEEDKIWLKKQLNNEKISQEQYEYQIKRISKFHAHGLRKYFINTISSYSGNLKVIRRMSGHASSESNDPSYVNIERKIIEKSYFSMIPYLSFRDTEVMVIDDRSTKKLKKEYEKLETENKLLKDNQQRTDDRVALIESILEDVNPDKLEELLKHE